MSGPFLVHLAAQQFVPQRLGLQPKPTGSSAGVVQPSSSWSTCLDSSAGEGGLQLGGGGWTVPVSGMLCVRKLLETNADMPLQVFFHQSLMCILLSTGTVWALL